MECIIKLLEATYIAQIMVVTIIIGVDHEYDRHTPKMDYVCLLLIPYYFAYWMLIKIQK